ncbi:MAG: class I SAM-dependent methyltransferase [Bacteroidales bacterium]
MSNKNSIEQPDNTAVRTALWRALHGLVDAKPLVIDDGVGLKLINPPEDWKERPDMKFTGRIRASIVARARFIEDLAMEKSRSGIGSYVLLGAGLDTFALRHPELSNSLNIYEIDQPSTLNWKKKRLQEPGFGIPENLHFVPVNFETENWREELVKAGFDKEKPAFIACTGVTLYLAKEAINQMLGEIKKFAPGTVLAITFYLPVDEIGAEDKPLMEMSVKGAQAAGTPMVSFFKPAEIMALANECGFKKIRIISTKDMEVLYFARRTDDLKPAEGEYFLVAEL